jgi:hypothetical protein
MWQVRRWMMSHANRPSKRHGSFWCAEVQKVEKTNG